MPVGGHSRDIRCQTGARRTPRPIDTPFDVADVQMLARLDC